MRRVRPAQWYEFCGPCEWHSSVLLAESGIPGRHVRIMNTLMLTNVYTPRLGGVTGRIPGFSQGLRERGHRVQIVIPQEVIPAGVNLETFGRAGHCRGQNQRAARSSSQRSVDRLEALSQRVVAARSDGEGDVLGRSLMFLEYEWNAWGAMARALGQAVSTTP